MIEKMGFIYPEIILFGFTCAVMIMGLSKDAAWRRLTPWCAALGLAIAGMLAINSPINPESLFPSLAPFAKTVVALVGLLTLLVMVGTVDRDFEKRIAAGQAVYSPTYATRAEFYAFFLFSLTGLMLVASADTLIWLFLALELTSLPTYMMVTISTRTDRSQEAGVKYFFLGALGAAVFLYGFALLYGATGTTQITEIARVFASGEISTLGMAGLLLSVIGVSFKIAAVPMHFYTPDVYQGAASPVSAFLAFTPKTAGFLAILMLVGTAGWRFGESHDNLPEALHVLLWVMAAATMTVGNVMALLQSSIKRMLAYSSIAHSGYMLVGVVAGPGLIGGPFWRSGVAAILFYLLAYGVMNLGAFAALACLERRDGSEADSFDDIRGLCVRAPIVGWSLVISALSLLGLPPLLGFLGKFGLFTAGVSAGELPLVVILGLNSAIAAFYYLRIVAAAALEKPDGEGPTLGPIMSRRVAAALSALGAAGLIVLGQQLMSASLEASRYLRPAPAMHEAATPQSPADELVEDHAEAMATREHD